MPPHKNLFYVLGEALGQWWDARRAPAALPASQKAGNRIGRWLPSRGSLIFTLLIAALLLWAQTASAIPLPGSRNAPTSSSGTIAYQGRLADAGGNPLTAVLNMEFRLYDAPTGGAPLWEELWTGANAVQVSDGLFNVMLGSLNAIPQYIVADHASLYLGITAGTDDEMTPRVQLGSVPFAIQALTVPDSSVATAKIADGAVTTAKLADGAITQQKAPSLIASATGSNVKIYHGRDSFVVNGTQTTLSKTVILPQPCTTRPKVLVQPTFNHHSDVIATVGQPWDNTLFTVFLTGPTWSNGQVQEFEWLVICN